ncbi:universal stress protein [Halovenus sp. WSH3]|uniref:Universal stress protein n=1 Tax=Halovenus carboxidivorans TaxID=2692199 RepID=A0A6B0TB99_9EURY|nr:universal stress protein [Halovenus carboxidivorans]MXR50459.1 universal stress protein [Halovenus carboxidivorans]
MTRVLLSIDEDESRAKSQAETVLDLLETDDLSVDLLHVFEENPEGATAQQMGSIRRAKEILEEAGVDVTVQGEGGDPAQQIVAHADDIDADAICISGRKRSPTGKVVFGSVTQDVILNTERSVLVCSPNEEM